MPFQSESQRRMMWSQHPDIAKRWSKEGPNTGLPMHKRKSRSQARSSRRSSRK